MEPDDMLAALLELARSLGIEVRKTLSGPSERGGALVRLKGKEILILDASAGQADQIVAAASALRGRPQLEERFLPPEIRAAIESAATDG
ncbi:MAG: hypothetical protein WC869_15090 [Phycisphaerae bacterium]|jgi:hypothetical protein